MEETSTGIRLFVADSLAAGADVTPTEGQCHYLLSVMRQKAGDHVLLFNGRDGEWQGEIAPAGKKSCRIVVSRLVRGQVPSPDVWLLFAPIRQARMDFLIEKAVELGVSRLLPVQTRRTQVGRINRQRLLLLATEAAEQCERLDVPDVAELTDLDTCLRHWPAERRLFACIERHGAEGFAETAARHGGPAAILIGPEGGFDEADRKLAMAVPTCIPVSLGAGILRSETAGLAALAVWQSVAGGWRS